MTPGPPPWHRAATAASSLRAPQPSCATTPRGARCGPSTQGPTPRRPAIDFRSRSLRRRRLPASGRRPAIPWITDARADAGGSTLVVQEHGPARGQASAQILVSPFHIVTFPRVDGEVRFRGRSRAATRPSQAAPVRPPRCVENGRCDGQPVASSTGLEPDFAAALAYLAGPFSGS